MVNVKKLSPYLQKKSIRAETLPDYDKMVVLGVSNKLGITETDHKKSKDLSKYQLIESGDFAYNPYRINVGSIGLVPTGVRGLVSPAYVVFSTNEDLLSELLFDFLKSRDGLFQIGKYARGTVRKALRFDDLCQIELPVPPLEAQKNILKKKISIKSDVDVLEEELNYQEILLKKLRQQILQEAIEGRLTSTWRAQNPDVEPASELLARIQAEKAQLIKEKKINKQKPLPSISEEEKPYKLSEEWKWLKIEYFLDYNKRGMITGPFGTALQKSEHQSKGIPVWGIETIKNGSFTYKNKIFVTLEKAKELNSFDAGSGDIIISRSGTIDEVCVIPKDVDAGLISTNLLRLSLIDRLVHPTYFCYLFKGSKSVLGKLKELCSGSTRLFLNQKILKALVFPVPPIEEQEVIVTKVKNLLALCDQLEAQISQNQSHAEQLMQSVLKEAFSKES